MMTVKELVEMAQRVEAAGKVTCSRCGHPASDHGQERNFYDCDDSRREVCLLCPDYEEPGYPNGKAWHRFKAEKGEP